MWGARKCSSVNFPGPRHKVFLLGVGLFIRYVAPVLVGAGVLTVGAYYFIRAIVRGLP